MNQGDLIISSSITVVRDGFRECGALGNLSFGAPSRCDLFGRLFEKREHMPLLCVVPPQKCIFCCADFGSTFALNVQQKLKPWVGFLGRFFYNNPGLNSVLEIPVANFYCLITPQTHPGHGRCVAS